MRFTLIHSSVVDTAGPCPGLADPPRAPLTLVLAVLAMVYAGCGGGADLQPRSALDSPAAHYEQGLQALADGNLWQALTEFERTRALDDDFPGGYVGEALAASQQGEYFRARQQIAQALHRDKNFVDAHVALGRVAAAEGAAKQADTDAWLAEATRAFDQAARLAPQRRDVDFFRAEVLSAAARYDDALLSYARVIADNRGPLVVRAMAATERLQVMQRAAPGTRGGQRIALQDSITKAELIVLLLDEMKLESLVQQRRPTGTVAAFRPPASSTDPGTRATPGAAAGAWAQPWIERAAGLGLAGLEPLPDGTLDVNATVTRADFARVVGGVLALLVPVDAAQGLGVRYVGEPSRFADVRADHFSYNAIALAVDRGIMQPDPVSGLFRPDEAISGGEALLTIRQLQNAVRMEF